MRYAQGLVTFLVEHSVCDQAFCSTCGGTFLFRLNLAHFLQAAGPPDELMLSMTPADLISLRDCGGGMRVLLSDLGQPVRQRIVSMWLSLAQSNELVAYSLFRWLLSGDFKVEVFDALAGPVVRILTPRALRDRKLRDDLRPLLSKISYSTLLQEAYERDAESDRKAAEAAERKHLAEKKKEQEFIVRSARLGAVERFRQILSNENLRPPSFPESWANASLDELAELEAAEIEGLIKYIGWNPGGEAAVLLGNLSRIRHEKRITQIELHRSRLRGLAPAEQLVALLREQSIPIEHFPVELAAWTDHSTVESLPLELRQRFLGLLSQTRLRRWRKLHRRLFGG